MLSPTAWEELLQLLEAKPADVPPALKAAAIAYRDAVANGRLQSRLDVSWVGSAGVAADASHDLESIHASIAQRTTGLVHQIELSAEEFAAFLRMIDDASEPAPALQAAARRYRDTLRTERRKALDELTDQAQALDLGY